MFVCVHACIHVCVYACMYEHACVCISIYVLVGMYLSTCTRRVMRIYDTIFSLLHMQRYDFNKC